MRKFLAGVIVTLACYLFLIVIHLINGTFERPQGATEDKTDQFQQTDDPPNKPFEIDRVLGASQSSTRSLLTTKYKILQMPGLSFQV